MALLISHQNASQVIILSGLTGKGAISCVSDQEEAGQLIWCTSPRSTSSHLRHRISRTAEVMGLPVEFFDSCACSLRYYIRHTVFFDFGFRPRTF
jgi:hypothetical protein